MPTILNRFLMFLGLVEEPMGREPNFGKPVYDDDEFEDEAPRRRARSVDSDLRRPTPPRPSRPVSSLSDPVSSTRPTIRPVSQATVRQVNSQARSADIDVVAPASYKDIKPMGESIKSRRVVIVNLRYAYDADESRRIKDFMAGATFVAGAKLRALTADKLVYLVSPTGVDVLDQVLEPFRARDFAPVN